VVAATERVGVRWIRVYAVRPPGAEPNRGSSVMLAFFAVSTVICHRIGT
jgi:hypothetical protein